ELPDAGSVREFFDSVDADAEQRSFGLVAHAGDGGNVASPGRERWSDRFFAMGQVRALLALEIDMKEGVIVSGADFLFLYVEERTATEVIDETKIGAEGEILLLPCVSFGVAVVWDAPDRSGRIDAAAQTEIAQDGLEHSGI